MLSFPLKKVLSECYTFAVQLEAHMMSGVKKYKILQYTHQISHLDLTIWQIFVNTFLPNVHF